MVLQLLKQGFSVTVWKRDVSKTSLLIERGTKLVDSPAEVVKLSDVVITMLRDDADLLKILMSILKVAKPGTTFIEMSPLTRRLAQDLANIMAQKGFYYLDALALNTKNASLDEKLTFWVAGSKETFEAQQALLEVIGQEIKYMGSDGDAIRGLLAVLGIVVPPLT